MSDVLIGLVGVAYYLPAGTIRTSWGGNLSSGVHTGAGAQASSLLPLNVIRNVKTSDKAGEANVSSRASDTKLSKAALFEKDVTFDIPWAPTDAGFKALIAAYYGRQTIAIAVLDQAVGNSGAQGPWCDWSIMSFEHDQDQTKEQMATVKLSPTSSAVPPEYVQVP